mmetsp:Transcript_49179/g.130203  ORF Transcript_49179/g.130203 Transcript_49179/m.130203 type:complete len:230 (-) Transcript_49179:607-1296(-)
MMQVERMKGRIGVVVGLQRCSTKRGRKPQSEVDGSILDTLFAGVCQQLVQILARYGRPSRFKTLQQLITRERSRVIDVKGPETIDETLDSLVVLIYIFCHQRQESLLILAKFPERLEVGQGGSCHWVHFDVHASHPRTGAQGRGGRSLTVLQDLIHQLNDMVIRTIHDARIPLFLVHVRPPQVPLDDGGTSSSVPVLQERVEHLPVQHRRHQVDEDDTHGPHITPLRKI